VDKVLVVIVVLIVRTWYPGGVGANSGILNMGQILDPYSKLLFVVYVLPS
jgi:hypothetical protein